ncbi:hypothetical protein ElyMa_000671100 [Elysia marginata]|uniref:Uncharacterized protein n=1 Tax=Elysia marginata TaxID=1093978 RepID=A0AAV4GH56_9GAST|nr:hypothetical protein ElyMa_000671100 [Elysia marginata]
MTKQPTSNGHASSCLEPEKSPSASPPQHQPSLCSTDLIRKKWSEKHTTWNYTGWQLLGWAVVALLVARLVFTLCTDLKGFATFLCDSEGKLFWSRSKENQVNKSHHAM